MTGEEFWGDAMANVARFAQDRPDRPDRPEAVQMPQTFQQVLAATDDESFTLGLRGVLPLYFAAKATVGDRQ